MLVNMYTYIHLYKARVMNRILHSAPKTNPIDTIGVWSEPLCAIRMLSFLRQSLLGILHRIEYENHSKC